MGCHFSEECGRESGNQDRSGNSKMGQLGEKSAESESFVGRAAGNATRFFPRWGKFNFTGSQTVRVILRTRRRICSYACSSCEKRSFPAFRRCHKFAARPKCACMDCFLLSGKWQHCSRLERAVIISLLTSAVCVKTSVDIVYSVLSQYVFSGYC